MPRSHDLRFQGIQPLIGDVRFIHHSRTTGDITANTTNNYAVATPVLPEKFYGARVSAEQVPADADGTILGRIRKYDASANAFVNITDELSLEGLTTKEGSVLAQAAGLDDADLIAEPGDVWYFTVVNNSAALNTQATNLNVTIMTTAVANS